MIKQTHMEDEKNPNMMFQTIHTDLLVAAVRGKIDLNQLVKAELAGRGLDRDGVWVGFERAKEIMELL